MSFWQLDDTWHLRSFEREDIENVIRTAYGWDVCLRCCLRCLAIKEAFFFKHSHENLAEIFKIDNREFVCIACLQLLQEKFCSDEFLENIKCKVKKHEVEFDDFFCALSLPVSQLIREHRLSIRLHNTFPAIFDWPSVKKNLTPLKDVWKWINGARFSRLLDIPFNQKSDFEIQIYFSYKFDDQEYTELDALLDEKKSDKKQTKCKKMNVFFNRMNVSQALDEAPIEIFNPETSVKKLKLSNGLDGAVEWSMKTKEGCDLHKVECLHQAIYVAGRYNKFSRELSQTPWIIQGERKHKQSVEELIASRIEECFKATSSKFSSSGREDVDVRMLGRGRPFILEVVAPRVIKVSEEVMRKVQADINAASDVVKVRDLQVVSKEEVKGLKTGEEDKIKKYRALCVVRGGEVSDEMIDSLNKMEGGIELQQQTPIRVLHRRVLATRPRTIHHIHATVVDRFGGGVKRRFEDLENYLEIDENKNEVECNGTKKDDIDNKEERLKNAEETLKKEDLNDKITLLVLELETQAGTYIKEFVHGDFNRTLPNLGSLLGVECDILLLDVVDVKVDWPKALNNDAT